MSVHELKQRVEARDRLVAQAERGGHALHEQALGALQRGDLRQAEAAIHRNDEHVQTLVENLRIYQAELYAQADELATSQAGTEAMLARFSALFSSMPVATLLVSGNGEVRDSNARAHTLLALRPGASSVRFLHRLVDPGQYQTRVRPAFHEAEAHGSCTLEAVRFVTEEGHAFFGDLHIAKLPLERDRNGQFACAVIDRTEHLNDLRALQDAAATLRESQSFLADTARLSRTGGWTLDAGSGVLSASREMCLLFETAGAPPASLEAVLALCAVHSRAALAAALESAAQLEQPFELELDMFSAGGRAMRVRAVGHPEPGRRVFGVFQDITGQHQAHRRIGDLTERLSVANDAGGIGVWDWDLTSDELFFDPRMCALLDLVSAPGSNLRAILKACLVAEDGLRFEAALQRSLQFREPLNVEVRLAAADAAEHWLHLAGRAQFDSTSQAVRLVGCAWDCSAEHDAARLKAAKESAEFASRSKSAFLSRMSHELRTPLNAILGFSQLMRMEAEAGDLQLKPHRVVLIETAARHLLDLVNEVLDVSRVESGQLEVRLMRFDLRDAVRECLPLVLGQAEAAGVVVDDGTAGGPPLWVLGDRLRLKEVLINLLSNAVKYNRPQGSVSVTAEVQGEHVALVVADTGLGLAEHQLAGLFQPFNRLGAESTTVEGSGMGLFVSKRFVELMGGDIAAHSQPGAGSTFTVRLNAPAG